MRSPRCYQGLLVGTQLGYDHLTDSGYPPAYLPQIHEAPVPNDWVLVECGPFSDSARVKQTCETIGALLEQLKVVGSHRWVGTNPTWRLQVWLPPQPELHRLVIFVLTIVEVPVISSPIT